MMMSKAIKRGLVISTATGTSELLSGASLRVSYISNILQSLKYEVKVVAISDVNNALSETYDVIVVISYACARILRKARTRTTNLWFDPYDSWLSFRLSMIRQLKLLHVLALIRDMYFIQRAPKLEIVTFISIDDARRHRKFSAKFNNYILPIQFPRIAVSQSSETRLMFVGDGKYSPNRQALALLNQIGEASGQIVNIVGRGYPERSNLAFCNFLGYVADSDLYHDKDIHLAPIISGAGIKTKIALPLFLGLRVIALEQAATGLRFNKNLKIAKNICDFTHHIFDFEQDRLWAYEGITEKIYEKDDLEELIRNL